MRSDESYAGFCDEQQKRYEDEIQQQSGKEKLEESRRKWGSYSAAEIKRILK